MADSVDIVGDLLREFYDTFGVPEEGPPLGLDVTAMLGGRALPQSEILVLQTALGDPVARWQFRKCRDLIQDLANRLTGEELLRELAGIPVPENGFEQLASGVFWFALASSLDQREDGLPITPFDTKLALPLPLKIQMTIQGSLVFRLYIALVHMREGVLSERLDKALEPEARVPEWFPSSLIRITCGAYAMRCRMARSPLA
jgi:hypothetical protein